MKVYILKKVCDERGLINIRHFVDFMGSLKNEFEKRFVDFKKIQSMYNFWIVALLCNLMVNKLMKSYVFSSAIKHLFKYKLLNSKQIIS